MENETITGLTSNEVKKRKALGLSNQKIDTYSPSYLRILRRNIFTLMNAVIIPLIFILAYFDLYREVTVFSIFVFINTLIATFDEVRTKRKLEKLKEEFQSTATVIRDKKEETIPISEIVKGDYVIAKEGEGIVADGKIIDEKYLQVDESILTGESNYVKKDIGDSVLSGSFVVTGSCIYIVDSVGKSNYINKIGSESLTYVNKKSPIEKAGASFLGFFVITALILSVINFYAAKEGGVPIADRILAVTTIMAMVIPQTLIVLFTLTFTISVVKLSSKGILVQKGSSIEELAGINVVCVDKTGTITTNKMKLAEKKYFNLSEGDIGPFYNSVSKNIAARNKTQELLDEIYKSSEKLKVTEFEQIPFTSKIKYSLIQARTGSTYKRLIFGAPSVLLEHVSPKLKSTISSYVEQKEQDGYRILVGIYSEYFEDKPDITEIGTAKGVAVYVIEETLNEGIREILARLKEQEIDIKIISGDSKISVTKVAEKIGIPTESIIDLSDSKVSLERIALEKTIFARAKPEDKVEIVKALQAQGKKVAMIGDGVNDVLSLKLANVGIAMESGAKITRDLADIVLLKNDYRKIPDIFYEGDNIIFNLKFATKIFFWKAITMAILVSFFSAKKMALPIWPSSTLVYSFLGNSLPSYIVAFSRQAVINRLKFTNEVVLSALPTGIFIGLATLVTYLVADYKNYSDIVINTSLVYALLTFSLVYLFYLLWHSGKLKNIKAIAFLFVLLMVIGITQSFLPITNYEELVPKLILVGMLAIGVLMVKILTVVAYGKNQGKVLRYFVNSLFIWGVPLGSFFPFRNYYVIEPIPFPIYAVMFSLAIPLLGAIVVSHKVVFKHVKDV
jgi:cation-transporting ATPase E